jgi:hypothetical protein
MRDVYIEHCDRYDCGLVKFSRPTLDISAGASNVDHPGDRSALWDSYSTTSRRIYGARIASNDPIHQS